MNPPDFRLDERIALVTGAASGIGRGIALGLAASGADVACFDLALVQAERLLPDALEQVLLLRARGSGGGRRGRQVPVGAGGAGRGRGELLAVHLARGRLNRRRADNDAAPNPLQCCIATSHDSA